MADGEQYTVPPTIEDPTVLDAYTELLPKLGYGNAPILQAQLVQRGADSPATA
jgi:hypothetical protein